MDLQNQLPVPPPKGITTVLLNGSLHDPLAPNLGPKVRKPYTISKQREKWTDEEHQKFLDALKLHGRAWRQIQEFIGTKTAVQIRSHAQKFFSKVVQSGNDESLVADIEIPPPRPKRKPMHPYPRKYVNPLNVIVSPSLQLEKRMRSNSATTDSENQSPNSVLPDTMSRTLEFPASESPDSCLSNSSCSTGTQYDNMSYGDREDNSEAINPTTSSTVDNSANIRIRLCENEEDDDLPEATIKLFGHIVSTKEFKRPSTNGSNTFVPLEQHLAVNSDDNYGKLEVSAAPNGLDPQMSHGLYYGNYGPWSWNGMNTDSNCASSMRWMPIPIYTSLSSPYLMSYGQNTASRFTEQRTLGKELWNSRMNKDSTEETIDKAYASSPKRTQKSGFVPYKRCSVSSTGPIDSAKNNAEEDGQRVQLCL